jgi:hypothetical protein
MRSGQAYAVVAVAVALAVVAYVLAEREHDYRTRFTSSVATLNARDDPPYLARHPWVAAGAAFGLGLVGGSVVVIAANSDRPRD